MRKISDDCSFLENGILKIDMRTDGDSIFSGFVFYIFLSNPLIDSSVAASVP